MGSVVWALNGHCGRRESHRLSVVVPALIRMGELNFTARLANIGRGGAMLETAAPMLAGGELTICCGTIVTEAVVIWRRHGRIGVNFHAPITEGQVQEQVLRSAAHAGRNTPSAK